MIIFQFHNMSAEFKYTQKYIKTKNKEKEGCKEHDQPEAMCQIVINS